MLCVCVFVCAWDQLKFIASAPASGSSSSSIGGGGIPSNDCRNATRQWQAMNDHLYIEQWSLCKKICIYISCANGAHLAKKFCIVCHTQRHRERMPTTSNNNNNNSARNDEWSMKKEATTIHHYICSTLNGIETVLNARTCIRRQQQRKKREGKCETKRNGIGLELAKTENSKMRVCVCSVRTKQKSERKKNSNVWMMLNILQSKKNGCAEQKKEEMNEPYFGYVRWFL